MLSITKKFEFEAAHFLDDEKKYGKCSNMHGHSYVLEVTVATPEDQLQDYMVMNFSIVKQVVKSRIIDRFDHTCLNKSTGLEFPTAESLCLYFKILIQRDLEVYGVKLTKIKLFETANSSAEWTL